MLLFVFETHTHVSSFPYKLITESMLQLKANSHGVGDKAFLEYQNLAQNVISIMLAFA